MTKRLPLPISTIKRLCALRDVSSDIATENIIRNTISSIMEYEYTEAITTLLILEKESPKLMDYKKEIERIKEAEIRYNNT